MNEFSTSSLTVLSILWCIFAFQCVVLHFQLRLVVLLKKEYPDQHFDSWSFSAITISITDMFFVVIWRFMDNA